MIRQLEADRLLVVATFFLVTVGVVMVYSTSYIVSLQRFGDEYLFLKRHLTFSMMGMVAFVVGMRIPYEFYRRVVYLILALSVIGLLLLYVNGVGHEVGGAKRWVKMPGFSFQPSELAKFAVLIFLAYSLEAKKDVIRSFSLGLLPNIIIPGVVIAMIMVEPDFGTAVTLGAVVLTMCFVAGVRTSYLAGLIVATLPVLYIIVTSFSYMMRRVMIFLDPWKDPDGAGFQTIQSFLAFGAGGVFGVGLGEGKQKLFYLPEAHTDFIFSVIGEEFGLIGVAFMIGLYILFLIGGVKVALKAKDLFGTYLALGFTFMLSLQAAVNMAVVLGMVPPKGIPLPFVSYGGTSLIVSLFAAGVILNVYIRSNEE